MSAGNRRRACFRTLPGLALLAALAAGPCAPSARAGVFGKVVPIGGHAADIALDEARGVLYIADFTGNRVDVMSTTDNSIANYYSIPDHPGSLALSPDGRYLVVTHYGNPADGSSNALTVINVDSGARQTFGLASPPLAVAFGIDGKALILTTTEFQLFDPVSGNTQTVTTVANVTSQALPVAAPSFPPQILAASMLALRDRTKIFGFTDHLIFSYKVDPNPQVTLLQYTATPTLGPRVISIKQDGSTYIAGWGLFGCGEGFLGDCQVGGPLVAQFPGATGTLNVGTVAYQSSTGTIYAQMSVSNPAPPPPGSQTVCLPDGRCVTVTDAPSASAPQSNVPPALLVMDADNLTVRERVQLQENLAGKSVFSSDESMLYAISDSGVTVFDMSQMRRTPRVVPSQEDVVFRGSFCDRGMSTQTINVVDPNGGSVPFSIRPSATASGLCSSGGIAFSPRSGITPAKVQITVDPNSLTQLGTTACTFEIQSAVAVNMPPPPANGVVESYTANVRSRLRVLVNNREPDYRGAFTNIPGSLVDILADPQRDRVYILRQDKNQVLVYDSTNFSQIATLRTSNTPTQMAITFDRKYLLVGHDNSQLAYVYDLDSLTAVRPIRFPFGHYPRSIAASANAILAASRVVGPTNTIDQVDMTTRLATPLPSLGIYTNSVSAKTTLVAAPNGGTVFAAQPDGNVMLYNATSDTFAVARKDVSSLGGSYAASSFGRYLVDRYLLNESLVQIGTVGETTPSGSVFVDQAGLLTQTSNAVGMISRFSPGSTASALPTRIVEAPLAPDPTNSPFIRTLAPLYNRTAIVSLTTSGFTVLPWNYDAAFAPPKLERIVNAADGTAPVAPGSLVSIFGQQLSPVSIASGGVPLPTALADSCLTVNGTVVPMMFVSPTQINGQLPYQVDGNATLVLRTPGGKSDGLNFTILPAAPSIFRNGTAGPDTSLPAVVRADSGELLTVSNPIHPRDGIVIYLTGLGRTAPAVDTGAPAPSDPLAAAIIQASVTLGGVSLPVTYSGLVPGQVGVYQINASVPFRGVPTGFDIPLTITQGGSSTTIPVRVVE